MPKRPETPVFLGAAARTTAGRVVLVGGGVRTVLWTCCVLLLTFSTGACNRKSGCPASENARVQTNKKGEFSKKRGSSNLFPKHMRRNR